MKFDTDLNEFNRLLADEVLPFFPGGVEAYQSDDETLLFRGPIPNSGEEKNVGTHVSVKLEKKVKEALEVADRSRRSEMMENLIQSLGGQIRAQYDRDNIGTYALQFSGGMDVL